MTYECEMCDGSESAISLEAYGHDVNTCIKNKQQSYRSRKGDNIKAFYLRR